MDRRSLIIYIDSWVYGFVNLSSVFVFCVLFLKIVRHLERAMALLVLLNFNKLQLQFIYIVYV